MKKRKAALRKKIARRAKYFVYMVKCKTGAYYTGYTGDLKKRIALHSSGKGAKYLRGKEPIELVYYRNYVNYKCALNEEKRIKTFPRKRKDKLVAGCSKAAIRKYFKKDPVILTV